MIDPSFVFTLLFAVLLMLGLLTKFYLATRQVRHVAQHRNQVPAAFASTISLPSHQKAADYTIAKTRLGMLEMAFAAALLLGWTLLGGIDTLNQALMRSSLAEYGTLVPKLALLAAFGLISGLLDLPFTLYKTFRLEERLSRSFTHALLSNCAAYGVGWAANDSMHAYAVRKSRASTTAWAQSATRMCWRPTCAIPMTPLLS